MILMFHYIFKNESIGIFWFRVYNCSMFLSYKLFKNKSLLDAAVQYHAQMHIHMNSLNTNIYVYSST